ncbi:MAG: hypothetical protein LBM03_01145 [Erysipelotrichaceae bacterium]|jgi:hypothetical protein|nr:hypothetical protein [Erysipelotrichaceae bacterium]
MKKNEEEIVVEENVEIPEKIVEETIIAEDIPTLTESEFKEKVETARLDLRRRYKNNKTASTIVTTIVVLLVIASFILMAQGEDAYKYTGYGIAGATLLGMIIYYVINRNKFPDATREYISFINVQFNSYVFESNNYEKIEMDPKDKLDTGELTADQIYKDISRSGSRNVVRGTFKGQDFLAADVAAYTRDGKQEVAAFVGKYVSLPNKISLEGRIIITIKGEKDIDLPSDFSGLTKGFEEGKMMIFVPEGVDYKKVLGVSFLKKINALKVEGFLMNINFVIWGGHTAIYMSYSDELMMIPFEAPFNDAPINQYKDEQLKVLEIASVINK